MVIELGGRMEYKRSILVKLFINMKSAKNNPQSNKLLPGLTESTLLEAVEKSGYPLQTIVANFLRAYFKKGEIFHLQEEWSYRDKDENELRTIDILAEKWLWNIEQGQPKVSPVLNLLIECKKSDLPYVFFLSPTKPWIPQFPLLAGLAKDEISNSNG